MQRDIARHRETDGQRQVLHLDRPEARELRFQIVAARRQSRHAVSPVGFRDGCPDDAGFEQIGYEVTTSKLKPGCAENAIVDGLVGLIRR